MWKYCEQLYSHVRNICILIMNYYSTKTNNWLKRSKGKFHFMPWYNYQNSKMFQKKTYKTHTRPKFFSPANKNVFVLFLYLSCEFVLKLSSHQYRQYVVPQNYYSYTFVHFKRVNSSKTRNDITRLYYWRRRERVKRKGREGKGGGGGRWWKTTTNKMVVWRK